MFILKYDVTENGPVKKNAINPLRTNVTPSTWLHPETITRL